MTAGHLLHHPVMKKGVSVAVRYNERDKKNVKCILIPKARSKCAIMPSLFPVLVTVPSQQTSVKPSAYISRCFKKFQMPLAKNASDKWLRDFPSGWAMIFMLFCCFSMKFRATLHLYQCPVLHSLEVRTI